MGHIKLGAHKAPWHGRACGGAKDRNDPLQLASLPARPCNCCGYHVPTVRQVHGYCLIKDGREAKVAYPTEGFDDDIAGRSFHHGRCAAAARPTQRPLTCLLG